MPGWKVHRGKAISLPFDSIDTDQLIPARFMSVPRTEGYGDYLLHDMRRGSNGDPDPNFPLNRHPTASVLVTGRNFGSGSSREAAVYALLDAGFRVIIAPSFGDIFAANAVNNGVLPAQVSPEDAASLTGVLKDGSGETTVDLDAQCIRISDMTTKFALDASWRTKLINGWDDIDLTLKHSDQIDRFKHDKRQSEPWVWPHQVHG